MYNIQSRKAGEYQINFDQLIGKGDKCTVFTASHPKYNNICAKILNKSYFPSDAIQINKDVLETLKNIKDCEYLVKIYDIIEDDQEIYIIMEQCKEKTLKNDLEKRQQQKQHYTTVEILDILKKIALGYSQLFDKGIIHKNLTPAKIFANNNEIKITDYVFGMIINEKVQQRSYSRICAPSYASPQRFLEPNYSSKSDVFSLGVILHQLLYLKMPFTGRTQKDLISQLKQLQIQPFKCEELPKFYQNQILIKDQAKQIVELIESMLVFSEEQRISWEDIINKFIESQCITTDLCITKDELMSQERKDISIQINIFQETIQFTLPNIKNHNVLLNDNNSIFYLIQILSNKAELAQKVQENLKKFIQLYLPYFQPFHQSLLFSSILGYQYTILENMCGIIQNNPELISNKIKKQYDKCIFPYLKEIFMKQNNLTLQKIIKFRDESLMQFMYFANIIQKMAETQQETEIFKVYIKLTDQWISDSKIYLKWFKYYYKKLLASYLNIKDLQNLQSEQVKALALILKFSKLDKEYPDNKLYSSQSADILLKDNLLVEELKEIAKKYHQFK